LGEARERFGRGFSVKGSAFRRFVGLSSAFVLLLAVPFLGGGGASAMVAGARLAFSKSLLGDQETVSGVGEMVTYTFRVANVGWVTVADVDIDESGFEGNWPLVFIECGFEVDGVFVVEHGLELGSIVLVAGEAIICQAQYTVTQEDIDDGVVNNTAFAKGVHGVFNESVQSDADSAAFEYDGTIT